MRSDDDSLWPEQFIGGKTPGTGHPSALGVASELMPASAQSIEEELQTRAANDDDINGGSGTRTKYGYVDNSPMTFVDPSGFDGTCTPQQIIWNLLNWHLVWNSDGSLDTDASTVTPGGIVVQSTPTCVNTPPSPLAQNAAGSSSTASPKIQQTHIPCLPGVQCIKPETCTRLSSWDPTIQSDVGQYNSDNGFSASDSAYLDPSLIEAMVSVESGHNIAAYFNDPMQANNQGDWTPQKANFTGLTQGRAPGPGAGIQAGIAWLTYKAYSYNAAGAPVSFRGWPSAVTRYNGGGDPNYLTKVQAAQDSINNGC